MTILKEDLFYFEMPIKEVKGTSKQVFMCFFCCRVFSIEVIVSPSDKTINQSFRLLKHKQWEISPEISLPRFILTRLSHVIFLHWRCYPDPTGSAMTAPPPLLSREEERKTQKHTLMD